MPAQTAPSAALEARIAELEARILHIEQSLGTAMEDIPWDVLLAAVAVSIPFAHRVRDVRILGNAQVNFWSIEGRTSHFASHRFRGG